MSDVAPSISVTVIGGYLGSGKTTLVNHLLSEAEERIAVLVNDFGEINVDLDLIERRSDDTIELSNGCICCSMVDGFSAALDRIVAFDPRPDRLVIETSGVADPAGVAAYGHGPGLALDAVVVLVDAETVRALAEDKYVAQTIRTQLAAAEILVVNKVDLVGQDELAATLDWLAGECPEAFVMTSTESRVPPEVLFGRPSTREHEPGHHHPEKVFESRVIEAGVVTRQWVDDLMAELPAETTVRAKGLVWLDGEERAFVLQRVGHRWSLRPSPGDWPSAPATQLIVIELR